MKVDRHKNKKCSMCGKAIWSSGKSGLCSDCLIKQRQEAKIAKWKECGDTNCKTATTIRGCIREYILNKQNCLCKICGIKNEWNGQKLNFVLDHIDGNASNNIESNLRLICPNCDSQIDTFKSKNKNSARDYRRK